MAGKNHRIAYALYMKDKWVYGESSLELLESNGVPVTPEEFDSSMKWKIFCPVCKTPLSRTPDSHAISKNNRTSHFKHLPTYTEITCRLKSTTKQGLSYKNEEEASKAVEDEELVVVSDWMNQPPSNDNESEDSKQYNQIAIEDEDGPETEIAIGRHDGEKFKVASKIFTVKALCNEFHKNLHRGYHFPESKFPMLLSDMLFDTDRISDQTDDKPRLFFGKIREYQELDQRNLIHIKNFRYGDFQIYTIPSYDERKQINKGAIGRYILFYSSLEWKDYTPRCLVYKWGEYSLLPRKYEKHLLNYSS